MHVSPSMPTHADAAYVPDADPPVGTFGAGTTKVPVTLRQVPCGVRQRVVRDVKIAGRTAGACRTTPDQLGLYDACVELLAIARDV